MRSFLSTVVALSLLTPAACGLAAPTRTFTPAKTRTAELRYVDDIPVAIFTGKPEEIGQQHADLLAEPGKAALDFPRRFAAEFGIEAFWPFMAQAGRTLIMNTPERHQHELAAIVQRSGLGDGELAVANTLLELRRMGCSSIIVEPSRSATGGPLFGRNFDFPTLGELHKYSILLVYRPEGKHAFASVGFPGLVGVFSGINDAGLSVATLDVEDSADGSRKFDPKGTPLAFVFRRILEECTTVDEAEALLRSEKATTWMNLAVCDRDGGAVFEITPETIARRDDDRGLARCTNHFRANGLSVGETCDRYDALGKLSMKSPLDVPAVQARLHAANQERLTFQTMVFEPRELVLHLALGEPPTSDDAMTRIELAPLFQGK
jgi:isopenicillin-N N-acyltransferase like protein